LPGIAGPIPSAALDKDYTQSIQILTNLSRQSK